MKKKPLYVSNHLYKEPKVTIKDCLTGQVGAEKIPLPEGCAGVLFVFRTKTGLRKWDGPKATWALFEEVNGAAK